MKYILLIFMIHGLGQCSVAAADWYFPVEKPGAKTGYASKNACEQAEAEACYDISQCSLEVCDLKSVSVDDPTKPIFNKSKVQSCSDEPDCYSLIAGGDYCQGEPTGSFPVVAQDFTEVYCAEPNGFQKMTVKRMIRDSAKEAAKASKEAAKAAKKTKADGLITDVESCIVDKSLNDNQFKTCVTKAIKYLIKDRLQESDL